MSDNGTLFTPLTLPCGLVLKNRLSLAPMTTWSSNFDGTIHEDEIHYLKRRSAGLGMAMTAACYVHPDGYAFHQQWGCHSDEMIQSLRLVADTIRSQGARPILQIHHGGRMCPSELLGRQPVSASAVAALRPDADVPRPLTENEIWETIEAFGEATRRAIEAGYDGVEIHGANTYLLQQFFSPHINRRTDEWGGSIQQRMRFPLEVLRAVRRIADGGPDTFAVGYRLSPEEIEEPGITIDDTLELTDALVNEGLDWLHISVRDYWKGSIRDKSDTTRPSTRIVERIDGRVPVIGVGKVYTPEDAEFVLNDGCSIVALGRILLMEPEWAMKVSSGKSDTIRVTLPAEGGTDQLTLPEPLYKRLLEVKGWLPVDRG